MCSEQTEQDRKSDTKKTSEYLVNLPKKKKKIKKHYSDNGSHLTLKTITTNRSWGNRLKMNQEWVGSTRASWCCDPSCPVVLLHDGLNT